MNRKIQLRLESGEHLLVDLNRILEMIEWCTDDIIHFKGNVEWTSSHFDIKPLVSIWRRMHGE